MMDLAATHPDLVTIETIGESYMKKKNKGTTDKITTNLSPGYDIYALNITAANTAHRHQSSEKGKLLITSGIHAREYTPTELVARFIELLIDGYINNDAQITSILQHTEIHTIIHVNPDGRYMAENFPDTYWRKNLNPTGCNIDGFYGVDINRNFDFLWGDEFGASSDPCSDEYHGTEPNSEMETQAVIEYARKVFPESQRRDDPEKQMNEALGDDVMGMYIDIHSTGEYIYYPWGHRDEVSPDDDAYSAIARKMSYFNGYDLWASGYDFIYPVSGDSSDYMYAVMGVASMGLELGFNFYENCDTFEKDILPSNLDALLYAASIAGRPFSLAKGPDILDVIVDYNNIDEEIIVTAEVSDALMVNSLNGEPDHQTGGHDIVKVVLYLDVHPDDLKDGDPAAWEMRPLDGEFDSNEEIVSISLSTRDISSGRHSLHVQAMDVDGYLGPVKSVSIEVEKKETILPSKYPTSAIMTALPLPTPLKLETAETSGNLSPMPPSPNLSQTSTTASGPPSNLTTTYPSTNPSQSPPHTTPSPTVLPETTPALSTANTPTTSIRSSSSAPIDDSSPLSTNSPTASRTSSKGSLQPTTTTTAIDDIRIPNNSVSAVASFLSLRLMTTTCALTCWILY